MKLSYIALIALMGCAAKPVEVLPGPAKKPWLAEQSFVQPAILYAQPYLVKSGDWLSKIALSEYGDTTKWHHIYAWNRAKIGDNPARIYPYVVLQLRQPTEWTGEVEYTLYTVQAGQSLWSIAEDVYGDGRAWVLIYHDNRGMIRGIGNMPIGLKLRVRYG